MGLLVRGNRGPIASLLSAVQRASDIFCYNASMIPTDSDIEALHHRYAPSDKVFTLVYDHCRIIAEIAEWCVKQNNIIVDVDLLRAGCLLHDIGTYALFDTEQLRGNMHNYPQHAIFGAALIVEEGFDARIADMVRTHVLMGLTREDITIANFGMPRKDYLPVSTEARLLCYADRFHSKYPEFNSYPTFLHHLQQRLPTQAAKMQAAAEEFGIPDVAMLAKKYGHPMK